MFLGIDLTSSENKPTACAVLDHGASLLRLTHVATDDEILALAEDYQPSIVAIDAPLGFPKGMCCLEGSCSCRSEWEFKGRECEREIIDQGISIYVTTKRSFIKPMIYRGIKLTGALRQRAHEIIEVYPYASKVYLFGKPIPKKTTREGLRFLVDRISDRVAGLTVHRQRLDHDLCDAIVAAYTAYLASVGRTKALGLEDEAQIVVPQPVDIGNPNC